MSMASLLILLQKEILKEVKTFYVNLYAKQSVNEDIVQTLPLGDLNKLSENEALGLEGEISLSELLAILKKQKNNKSLMSDGFSAEFYNFFW